MANNNHFNLTLDTLAPENCSITRSDEYIKENGTLTIAATGAAYMKVWFNENAEGSTDDAEFPANWEAYASSKTTNFTTDGTYYYHAIFKDDVNNESEVCNTGRIFFDTTAPVVSDAYMEDPDSGSRTITNDKTGIKFGFSFNDPLSGVDHAIVTGDDIDTINITSLSTSPYEGTLSFKADVEDGTKTIKITVFDKSGNFSEITCSITLDTVLDAPILILLKNQETEETLPAYINYTGIKAKLTAKQEKIVGYKIWEEDQPEPAYITQEAAAVNYVTELTLSSGDGLKTIHAKIKDTAGTEAEATVKTVTVDTVKPVVELSSDKTIISKISGFDTAILTLNLSDALSGIKSWSLKCGEVQIDTGTAAVSKTFNLTAANSMVEGSNKISLVVEDIAGNIETKEVSVILDTTSPELSIGSLNVWYNSQFNISTTSSDTNGVAKLECWTSTVAADQTVPTNTPVVEDPSATQEVASANIKWGLAQSDSNYMHVKATDIVGNVVYAHVKFGYDDVAPVAGSFKFNKAEYNTTSATLTIDASDATSGISEMKISGDIVGGGNWETYAASKSVTLSEGDGIKEVVIIYKDVAGNISVNKAASGVDKASTELDTTAPVAEIVLRKPDDSADKEAHSAVAEFKARISYTDDEVGSQVVQYKLYGDFAIGAQGTTSEVEAEWKDFTKDSGQNYMTVSNLFCSDNPSDEAVTKHVYVKFKDAAGNVSEQVGAEFEYDKSAPIPVVSDVDYNRISKVHSFRHASATELTNKYADETNFSFTPDDFIQAYKVVAYKDATAAIAGSHEDEAIPTTGGSTNMAATGLNQKTKVNCMIRGLDFENALGGVGNDGAHIVVVYVQNVAGTWSIAAEF